MQHQPGMGFEYLAKLSTPPPGSTIKYCDSPYHIIFTNVKTKSQTYGNGGRPAPWLDSSAKFWTSCVSPEWRGGRPRAGPHNPHTSGASSAPPRDHTPPQLSPPPLVPPP